MKPLIRFDWAIKRLLRDKANFGILEGFLSELLMEDITIIEILESESNRATAAEMSISVNLMAKNDKSEFIIIEIHNASDIDYFHRMLFGASNLITQYIDKGQHFRNQKKMVSICIISAVANESCPRKDYIYKSVNKFTGLYERDVFKLSGEQKVLLEKEDVEDIFPQYYIIKVNSFNDIAKDTLDEWIYFLKNADLPKPYSAKGLAEANNKLKVLAMDDQERKEYEGYLDHLSLKEASALQIYTC